MQGQNSPPGKQPSAQTLILRCWQALDGSWRFTIELVEESNSLRMGFVSQAVLLQFLRDYMPKDEDLLHPDASQTTG